MNRIAATVISALLLAGAATVSTIAESSRFGIINIDKSFVSPDMHLAGVRGPVKRVTLRTQGKTTVMKFDMTGTLTNPSSLTGLSGVRFKSRRDSRGRLIKLFNTSDTLGRMTIDLIWNGDVMKQINMSADNATQSTKYFYDENGLVTRKEVIFTQGNHKTERTIEYSYTNYEPTNFNWTGRKVSVVERHICDDEIVANDEYSFDENRTIEFTKAKAGGNKFPF